VEVGAQGNDFPFSPGVPIDFSPNIPVTMPVNGGQWAWGQTKWGPVQLNAHKGDKIVMDYVMDYWRFAITYTAPLASAGNIHYNWDQSVTNRSAWWRGGDDNHDGYPDLGYWCLRCEFIFEAGEDYPWVWIAYNGNSDFNAHLEIKQIIPAPP